MNTWLPTPSPPPRRASMTSPGQSPSMASPRMLARSARSRSAPAGRVSVQRSSTCCSTPAAPAVARERAFGMIAAASLLGRWSAAAATARPLRCLRWCRFTSSNERWIGDGKRTVWREVPNSSLQPVGRSVDLVATFSADVGQQAVGDRPVRALHPGADDLAVHPDRRTGVAVAVEDVGAMRAEVPLTFLPPHDRGVEAWEERDPGLRLGHRLEVVGQQPGGPAVLELDLDRSAAVSAARRGLGPAGPPLQVGSGARTERMQPPAGELAARIVGRAQSLATRRGRRRARSPSGPRCTGR